MRSGKKEEPAYWVESDNVQEDDDTGEAVGEVGAFVYVQGRQYANQ